MAFSNLYSAICRGKWFISFREVDANQRLVSSLLEHSALVDERPILSKREPLMARVVSASYDEDDGKLMPDFNEAPDNSIAIIPLHGTMMKYGTMCSYGTTEIAEMIRAAVNSPKISSILLDIDSGGGSVDAIAPMVDAIQLALAAGKPVGAHCDLCASAAYYVASYCSSIIGENAISSEFGSIGVMMSFADYSNYYKDLGIKVHTIYSSLSDYKNAPFEAALKGDYDAIRTEELDPLAREFQDNVKANRGSKLKLDTPGLLNGRMFYHNNAVETGLADAIGNREFAIAKMRELESDDFINQYINSKK